MQFNETITAITQANINAMKDALDNPATDVPEHALEAAVSIGGDVNTVTADLIFTSDVPAYVVTHHTQTGTRMEQHRLAMGLTIRNNAVATVSYRNPETGEHDEYALTKEQQEVLDAYVAKAAFHLTGISNWELLGPPSAEDVVAEENMDEVMQRLGQALQEAHVLSEAAAEFMEECEQESPADSTAAWNRNLAALVNQCVQTAFTMQQQIISPDNDE